MILEGEPADIDSMNGDIGTDDMIVEMGWMAMIAMIARRYVDF